MKTAFFISDSYALSGPSVVNRYYRENLAHKYTFLAPQSYVKRVVFSIKDILLHKIIVFSGASFTDRLFLIVAKLFRRKIIYIMHGCIAEENRINHRDAPNEVKLENLYLKNADLILAVSEQFCEWVKEQYPAVSEKVFSLINGIDWNCVRPDIAKKKEFSGQMSTVGGGMPRKNILSVCRALQELNDEGHTLELKVFGEDNLDTDAIKAYPFVHYFGKIERDKLFEEMAQTSLFIQNSIFDSFALAPLEALSCGCSILCSKNVGALSIFNNLEENDVIEDCFDTREIKQKIVYLLKNPNCERLTEGLDKKETSFENRAAQLDGYIQNLVNS